MTNKKFSADKEIVLAAVKNDGLALEYASEELKADREIVLTAVQNDSDALRFACEKLKSDREIVLAAVKKNGYTLEYASNTLKADKEVVLAAVKDGWASLEYASDELKNDKNFVLEVIKHSEHSFEILEYASAELKADKDVVLAAVKEDGSHLRYASENLRADREIILEAVKKDGSALQYAIDDANKRMKRNTQLRPAYGCSWKIPDPSSVLEGCIVGRPTDEEIQEWKANARKQRAEWKPSEGAMQYFEEVKKCCVGHRVEIQIWDPIMVMLDDEGPHPFEADCKDVVILDDGEFPQAYLVVDNIVEFPWSELGYSPRRSLGSRNDMAGQLVSLADISDLWVE